MYLVANWLLLANSSSRCFAMTMLLFVSLCIQKLIKEIKYFKKVSVCVVTCLVYVHNSQYTTRTFLTTSVTYSRHRG